LKYLRSSDNLFSMSTQQQIAQRLGLSQAVVSAALNGKKKGVSQGTYDRIWEYSQKIGYRPKGMRMEIPAHRLKSGSIGFILRSGLRLDNQNAYFSQIQSGMCDYLGQKGIFPAFLGSEQTLDGDQLRRIEGVDGLVVFGQVEPGFLEQLRKITPAIVVISASYPGRCHSIQPNEEQGAGLIVGHLWQLGHRRTGWAGGLAGRQRSSQRKEAFLAALERHQQKIASRHIVEFSEASYRQGREAAQHFLGLPTARRPTALLCFNSLMARAAVNHFLQCGVRVPEDICVASMDRTHVCLEDHPTLTSVGADPQQMGMLAGQLVFDLMGDSGKILYDALVPSTLEALESTCLGSRVGETAAAP